MPLPSVIMLMFTMLMVGLFVHGKSYGLAAMNFCLFLVTLLAPIIKALNHHP